jgi:hypothetical protein
MAFLAKRRFAVLSASNLVWLDLKKGLGVVAHITSPQSMAIPGVKEKLALSVPKMV